MGNIIITGCGNDYIKKMALETLVDLMQHHEISVFSIGSEGLNICEIIERLSEKNNRAEIVIIEQMIDAVNQVPEKFLGEQLEMLVPSIAPKKDYFHEKIPKPHNNRFVKRNSRKSTWK